MIEVENADYSGAVTLKRDVQRPGYVLIQSHEYDGVSGIDVFDLGSFPAADLITALEIPQTHPPISQALIIPKYKPTFWDRLLGRVEERS